MDKEIEAKYLNIDKEAARAKLRGIGFELQHAEYLMRRKTFDFSRVAPGRNKWGRVRQEADKVTMTVKEVTGTGINDVFELEMTVDDFDKASQMFEQCNIPAKSFQENYRETWIRGSASVTLDTWPGINPFVEVEAESVDQVKEISTELQLPFEQAIFGSIDTLYERELGISAADIVRMSEITFDSPPQKIKGATE